MYSQIIQKVVDAGDTEVLNPAALKSHPKIRANYSSGPGSGSDKEAHARLNAREAAARPSVTRPPALKVSVYSPS